MANNIVAIAGIHTGIGKTVASAVLAEAIGADYWKPVQAGTAEMDSEIIRSLISDAGERVHKEAIVLTQPLSPHAAARMDGVTIDFTKFKFPVTNKTLLVETAGGVLSPISETTTMADFIAWYGLPTLLVVKNYLGSINHTLLSIEVLKARSIKLLGLIINGDTNNTSESFIEQYSNLPVIARIPQFSTLNREPVAAYAKGLYNAANMKNLFSQIAVADERY